MWFLRHHDQTRVQAPVAGIYQAIPTVANPQQMGLLAMQPTDAVINAPLDGDIISLSSSRVSFKALNGQRFELRIDTPDYQNSCDWQVRIGDSVSPLTILGTLNGNLASITIAIYRIDSIPATNLVTAAND
ncbi:hypothetical protein N7X57_08650 [Lactiplantibacillus paraplantarum]|uniref:hypothetical protein n=1 Tax=Lactiplantibacillus paraplantarum TaxID=60520 RepID=UPI0005140CB6|nr:hypothetical protein [Lactiplantibacillus paraplantarum]OAX76838.1 hypothetical protein A0U96_08350 [Lactiplantibacillus plantarum]ALO04475.1 hypothetical protein ASU28_08965 [Lactiplantibacillus paraplantarum]KGE75162.1 hypothetical protein HR47_07750 [Lactiplantibacillus paraplantarum]MCT4457099.1 hypothetical protein [Lactiplantibacillus paraplantarum]MCW1910516.1 hypothetical protein [Lactiplantibacillus paraplantarum]